MLSITISQKIYQTGYELLGPIILVATCGAGVTAAAGTSLTHHLFAKIFTLGKSLAKSKALWIPLSHFRAL